jgi:hypothetical protein
VRDIPIFTNFSEKEKIQFAEMDHPILAFNEGDTIIKKGDHSRSLFLLLWWRELSPFTASIDLSGSYILKELIDPCHMLMKNGMY